MADIVLNWEIGNSWHSTQDGSGLGSVGWGMEDGGWPAFIAEQVEPAIAWCQASNKTPAILIHHPFGMYHSENMRLDYWDYASAFGLKFLTTNFATRTGWRSVTSRVDCYAYLGGIDLTESLRNLPPATLVALIKRNLNPIRQAGFKGIYIDYAENAIPHPYGTDPAAPTYARRSIDTLTLKIADEMFPEPAGIEAAPRAFADFGGLWHRKLVAQDSVWRSRYGGFSPEQITLYGYGLRNSNHVALGYNRSVLTGEVWRTIPMSDDSDRVLELAQLIVGEGDVPAITPLSFIVDNIPASEVV